MTFSVTAVGTAPLSYQWRKEGGALAGATASSLTLTNLQGADAGNYDVVVSNAYSSAVSSNALLIVRTIPVITSQPVRAEPLRRLCRRLFCLCGWPNPVALPVEV